MVEFAIQIDILSEHLTKLFEWNLFKVFKFPG